MRKSDDHSSAEVSNNKLEKLPADSKVAYRLNIERAYVVVLIFFLLLVFVSPPLDVTPEDPELPLITLDVENIPVTRQARRTPPPPRPTVPIPSDKETIPEELTIEETTLQTTQYSDTDGVPSPLGLSLVPPRPISWVFPEYPEEERKRGVTGVVVVSIHVGADGDVIDAIVIENTTGSERCAEAALEAAYGSRFLPAREGAKPVSHWISQPYQFDIRD